jgi:hypothetical protein
MLNCCLPVLLALLFHGRNPVCFHSHLEAHKSTKIYVVEVRHNANIYYDPKSRPAIAQVYALELNTRRKLTRCLNHCLPWSPSASRKPLSAGISRSFKTRNFKST